MTAGRNTSANAGREPRVFISYARSDGEHSLHGYTSAVSGCAISLAGDSIVSTSSDETIKVWDAHTGACLSTLYVNGPLIACAFHPDGEHIVAAGYGGVYFLRWVR